MTKTASITGALLLTVGVLFAALTSSPAFGADPEFALRKPVLESFRDGIPHTLDKIARGEPIVVAYFGGSITAANGWRVQTLEEFNKAYAPSVFTEVNAAIGGTGSDLGVYRMERDVLPFKPDLVFVEFSVNDGGTSPNQIWRQIEGIVRKIWRASLDTDIVFVYTFCSGREKDYEGGADPRAVSAQEDVAEFYGIPSLDFNIPVVQLANEGKLVYKPTEESHEGKILFSEDGVHPLTEGHRIYTKVVCDAFEKMKSAHKEKPYSDPKTREEKLKKVRIEDNYESARMLPISESQLKGTWRLLPNDSPLNWMKSRLGDSIYTSDEPGASLTIRFKGSHLAIYDVLGPNGGQVNITLDGEKRERPVPRFDSYCTYWRLATLYVTGDADPDKEHVAVIEIDEKEPDRQSVAFRLKNPEKELAEPPYIGKNVWFGQIMVIGDVIAE